jgi:hypothetical protein
MTDEIFAEFKAYWKLSEELIGKATKEQLAEVARILALQSAHYARKHGELPLPSLFELLKATELDPAKVELLRDGTEAFVGVLAVVTGGIDDEGESPMQ